LYKCTKHTLLIIEGNVLPSMHTKQNNAFTFWANQGPKVTFFYKIGLHSCFDQCISNKILKFFYTFWVQERILCKNSNWSMPIYIWGKALKDTRKLRAWSDLHMHMSHHSRIKFKLIITVTIAICFNSKSIHTHLTQWCIIGHEIEMVAWSNNLSIFFQHFTTLSLKWKFNLGPPSITCPTTSQVLNYLLLIMG
jgi:hypothetical protein